MDPDADPAIFIIDFSRRQQNTNFKKSLKVHLHHFFKD
jgi:hypothetical protein